MTYSLVALFFLSGKAFVERTGLSLQSCAGYAVMHRTQSLELVEKTGEVQYKCVEEHERSR